MAKNKIHSFITKHNSISISRFINFCLYEPKNGYYQKKKVGEDFLTSPEISQMFGECISVFFALILKKINTKINFCEFGPGNGNLIKDITRSMYRIKKQKINYFFWEKSNFLNEENFKNLQSKANIKKLQKLSFKKEPYFFICNEFFDALPVNQFKKHNDNLYERRIKFHSEKLKIFNKKVNSSFKEDFNLKNGEIIESSPLLKLYLKKILNHIKKFKGGIIIFDYAPFLKEKIDTIQAIYNKRKCHFLDHPYDSDITYHIDLKEICDLAIKKNLRVYGPINQKKFLFYNGINERHNLLLMNCKSIKQKKMLNFQFQRLTDPNGLGGLIKCMYICNENLNLKVFNE